MRSSSSYLDHTHRYAPNNVPRNLESHELSSATKNFYRNKACYLECGKVLLLHESFTCPFAFLQPCKKLFCIGLEWGEVHEKFLIFDLLKVSLHPFLHGPEHKSL